MPAAEYTWEKQSESASGREREKKAYIYSDGSLFT